MCIRDSPGTARPPRSARPPGPTGAPRSAGPPGRTLAAAPPPAPAPGGVVQRALHGLGDEGVQGHALGGRGLLGLGLEFVEQAEGDPADVAGAVAAVGWGRGWWRVVGFAVVVGQAAGDHDPDVPAVQPDLDHAILQGHGDLGGQVGQGVHDRQPGRWLQGRGQHGGGPLGVLGAGGGGRGQAVAEGGEIGREIHDVSMASLMTSHKQSLGDSVMS